MNTQEILEAISGTSDWNEEVGRHIDVDSIGDDILRITVWDPSDVHRVESTVLLKVVVTTGVASA